MKDSKIEWTDHTFNPWIGCTKVSPGCANCYAAAQDKFRSWTPEGWGAGKPRKRTSSSNWSQPVKWNRAAGKAKQDHAGYLNDQDIAYSTLYSEPRRPRVFCASLADWLDDEVPVEWLADLLALIIATPNLDWLLLTKRPQNWRKRMEAVCGIDGDSLAWSWLRGTPPANVWVGTTVEDQLRADERVPHLLKIPSRVRFLSCEPLLGPVDLKKGLWKHIPLSEVPGIALDDGAYACSEFLQCRAEIHWVIAGGESGPGARPMHPDWARSLRAQCAAADVPFLFKQWGEWLPACQYSERALMRAGKEQHTFGKFAHSFRVGKSAAGRLLDGIECNRFPTP